MPDIISAVKVPQLIKDPVLTGSNVLIAKSGTPVMFNGGFSMVFPMVKGGEKWGMKVWHTPIEHVKERYKEISVFLKGKNIRCFADFAYVENGILVNGQLLDTSRMKWVDGPLLKDFIRENLNNPTKLNEFADKFLSLTKELHSQSISHGDLQHGNIIIQKNGSLTLIDYDSICVPSMDGQKELVTGLIGYQHPSRFSSSTCSVKADYFSELVIYLSVLAIAEQPGLWAQYQVDDTEVLLFSREDFESFGQSSIKTDLLKLSPTIKFLVSILGDYLAEKSFTNILPFQEYLKPPAIVKFTWTGSPSEIIAGEEIMLEWETENAHEITIENIGPVGSIGSQKLLLKKTTVFTLKAANFFNQQAAQSVCIKVHPRPEIVLFKAENDKIKPRQATNLRWQVIYAETIWLNGEDITKESKNGKGSAAVQPEEDTEYMLEIRSTGNRVSVTAKIKISVFSPVKVISFTSNSPFTIQGKPVILRWEVFHANKLVIEPGVGDVTNAGEVEVTPRDSTTFRMVASNELFGDNRKTVRIEVLPLPRIMSLQFPKPPVIYSTNFPEMSFRVPEIDSPVEGGFQNKQHLFQSSISGPFAAIMKFLQKEFPFPKTSSIKNKYKL